MFDGLEDAYPLTPLQQGMLYETLKNPDSDVYVAYIMIDVRPALDNERLQAAWLRTVQKHESLRTRFIWEGLDEPLQLVETDARLKWTECSNPSFEANIISKRSDDIVDYWLQCERKLSLSLSDSPPMRLRLIALPNGEQVLIWTVHHLLADDWSTPLVLKTVADCYDAGGTVSGSPSIQTEQLAYSRYVDWLSGSNNEASIEWWVNKLISAQPTPLLLGGSNKEASASSTDQHQRVCRVLGIDESRAMKRMSGSVGCTLSTMMHAAWAIVVARFAGEKSALFGTSVSGRSADLPAIEDAVGLFLHTLPTHVLIRDDELIEEYLIRVQEQLFKQIEHEHIDLPALNKLISREPGCEPFETVLVVEAHGPDLSIAIPAESASLTNIRYVTDSNFPLTVLVFPGDQIQIHLVGPNSSFLLSELEQISDEFIAVITDLCGPEVRLVGELFHCQEQRMEAQYPYRSLAVLPSHETIDEWIVCTTEHCLSEIAVIDEGVEFTYQQLFDHAQIIALQLRKHSNLSAFVGIHLDRGYSQIASILGVLISGKAYVPMDCAWPDERIVAVVRDAGMGLVLSDNSKGMCDALREVDVLDIYSCLSISKATDILPIPMEMNHSKQDAAYMIYTSGSTGQPKGVCISHENLVYSTAARIEWYREKPKRYLLLSSFSFDSSIAGIFWTLCSGGTLVLPGKAQAQDVHQLEEQIYRQRVTHTLCLPSLYMLLLRFAVTEKLKSLSCVIVAGEACPVSLPAKHNELLCDTRLFNEYGPTEATVWSTVAKLSGCENGFSSGIPIGHSIPGSRVRVVDHHGRIVPRGIAGELQICGPGVANGYYGEPDITVRKFKSLPDLYLVPSDVPSAMESAYQTGDQGILDSDGQLYFLGRNDRQLKVRGYRVEAGEIESRILANSLVQEAFCCLQFIGANSESQVNQRLVCFYTLVGAPESKEPCVLLETDTLADQRKSVEREVQALIKHELPAHFEVSAFAAVNVMARLSNGKMDESGFPHLTPALDSSLAAGSLQLASLDIKPTFTGLCQVLSQLLGIQEIQPSDNFFSLGGDSLAAIRFVATSREHGLMLTIPMITANSTMAELADALYQNELAQSAKQGAKQLTTNSSQPSNEHILIQGSTQNLVSSSLPAGILALEDFGVTPLSPVQRWFTSLNQVCPTHWNMAFVINLSVAAPSEKVCDAIYNSLKANPVLASQFEASVDNAMVQIEEFPDFTQCIHHSPDDDTQMEVRLALLQQEFDLQAGQLIRFSVGYDSDNACKQIGVVVHHLVTDALSNWLLANEITRRLSGVCDLQPTPASSLSYRAWSTQIARVLPVRQDIATEVISAAQRIIPTRICVEENVIEHRLSIDTTLWRSMRDFAQNQNVELHELCLHVILQSWQRQGPIRVDVETHGRDVADVHGDTSATIGWFTAFFKLLVEASQLDNVAQFSQFFQQKKSAGCQEFLETPDSFFGHAGMFDSNESTPTFLFNFLAMERDDSINNSGFTLTSLVDSRFRDKQSQRSHALEVIVLDDEGGVTVLWRADKRMLNSLGIENWIAAVQSNLHATLHGPLKVDISQKEQALSEQFPDSGLDENELNQFLSSFD